MSYDLSVQPDGTAPAPLETVASLIEKYPFQGEAPGYRYENEEASIYFELDLSFVDANDVLIDVKQNGIVNRIDIHIPGAYFETSIALAQKTANEFAATLKWVVIDEQQVSFESLNDEAVFGKEITGIPSKKEFITRLLLILIGGAAFVVLAIYLIVRYVLEPLKG